MNGALQRRYFTNSRHSLRDEYELDFSDLSPSRASSPASAKSEGPRHHTRRQTQVEEYRRKVARLRSELDMEKARNRQVYKEKSREIRTLRETYKEDRRYELDMLESKLKDEKKKEMGQLREQLLKEKDQELQQVLKYKEEEVKNLKTKLTSDKSETDNAKTEMNKTPTKVVKLPRDMDLLRRMEEEIQKLKDENASWESKYKEKCEDQTRKEKEFGKMKEDYDTELRRIISESKKLALGNLKKLKRAEIALSESMFSDDESVSVVSEKSSSRRSLVNIEDNMSSTMSLNKTLDKQSSVTSDSDRDETKREEREKEKSLQKKVTELQGQIQRLERRITLLRTENETLRKQKDDHKPLEEKIKALKKRNAELAAIARRLEEKAKHLQQENTKKTKEEGLPDSDQLKRLFARQRAKDLAEHTKSMLTKDREIEDLRKKCQELADQLSNGDYLIPENAQVYEEKEELVTIIKQAAKERLQLERQVAKTKPGEVVQQGDPERSRHVKDLEVSNQELQQEVHELEKSVQRTKHLDADLKQKAEQCDILKASIGKQREHNQELETDLKTSEARNTQLTFEVADLHHRLKDYDKVNEECSTLRLSLAEVQQEREVAKEDVSTLQYKVDSLEILVRDLQLSSEQLHQLDNDYQEALRKLEHKQSEIDRLHESQEEAKIEHETAVRELQIRIQDLERQCQVHEHRQADLKSELTAIKHEALHHRALTTSTEIQTERTQHISTGTDALPLLPSNSYNRRSSSNQNGHSVEDPVVSSHFSLSESTVGYIPTSESSKSLDTGFAEEELEDDLSSNNKSSPNKSDCEDPELNEISKKLKELAASDSDDDNQKSLEEKEDSGMESNRGSKNQNEIALSESRMSSLARKGPIQVYCAKYSYRPYEHSPNDNPDAELPLNAGDYVLVLGEMDEDGFFEGELVDGRRGLVPSNFIEKVAEEDLSDFHAAMAVAGLPTDDSIASNSHQDLEFNSSDEIDKLRSDLTEDGRRRLDAHGDLSSMDHVDGTRNAGSKAMPFPRNLSIDRQLTNSVLLSWKPPEQASGLEVSSYHIFIDKEFKTSVRGSERTKALVEGVDSRDIHRISVRCLSNKGQSVDAQCTVLVGKDATPTPSELKISDITANSATVSWLPGNSTYQHSIAVNGKEVRVVKPSVCKHTLTGLAPNAVHKVTVQAKSLTATYEDEKNQKRKEMLSASTEFKTVAGGLPDPPLNVQVEAGPQEGTLLLTWLPVTINTSGFSNGAVVTGYVVYADGHRAKEAKGPTNDHIVLGAEDFQGFIPKQLTVRTLTVDRKESADSSVVRLPHNLIKEVTARAAKTVASEVMSRSSHRSSKSPTGNSENAGNDTDEEIEAAFREAQEAGEQLSMSPENSNYADPYIESSSSELSDIPEVEEELIGAEETNQNADVSGHSLSLVAPYTQATNQADDRKSPKPAPRKTGVVGLSPNSDPSFQREDTPGSDKLLPLQRKIPAIEITRDSSTERGTSFEDDSENLPKRSSSFEPSEQQSETPRNTPPVVSRRRVSPGQNFNADSDKKDFRDRKMTTPTSADFDRSHDHGSPRGQTPIKSRRISPQSPGFRENRSTPNENGHDLDFDENGDVDSISGEINPPVDDNTIRLFIALFDYDPHVMSPNMDGADEELPFREGQIIKIYGEKDADGFYRGECNGHLGYVPCNMVSEIHIDDPELIDQLLKESQGNPVNKSQLPQDKDYHPKIETSSHRTLNGLPPILPDEVGRRMIAVYDYDPQELSPNVDSELELTFKAGDIITVYGEMDEDGFFRGEMNTRRGFVPSNFLQEATGPLSDDEALESASMVSPSRSGESISALSRNSDGIANTTRLDPPSPRSEHLKLDHVISPSPRVPQSNQLQSEEDKRKKKGGILNKGKNIFKKLAR
ncbi:RIMS-binding protein 2-like isoform X1 [Haliotis rufescens]|uniref:RIMS-binding protein 2-like isoform X1 n=1 Tax=Haliotis rufescens TaxID=6454 RepID=UPI00201F0C88|nr:RIMS-binding protein 2-like isoform X1 [Haliotis rufescens]